MATTVHSASRLMQRIRSAMSDVEVATAEAFLDVGQSIEERDVGQLSTDVDNLAIVEQCLLKASQTLNYIEDGQAAPPLPATWKRLRPEARRR